MKFSVASGLVCAALLISGGCGAVQHGYKLGDVVARSLSTATPEGAMRLANELQYDSAVREIVARKGQPEWLHIVNRDQLYLYFTSLDEVVVITRPMVPPGEVKIYERTPGFLLNLLPKPSVDALLAKRSARTRAKATPVSRSRRKSAPRAAVARPKPDTSVSFRDFDPRRIVTQLRMPLTAADAGVTQWRDGQMRDGKPARIATSGTSRYVVGTGTVSVSAPIAPRRQRAPSNAHHAIHRINQAVFGARADDIARRVGPLVSQVAADTSGRTRINRRVGGRTVSVARDTQRGLLIYSIFSE